MSKLWRYNLHYFDDLRAEHAEERYRWHRELMNRWVNENPPGRGTGWEPYPTSLRIVNWISWAAAGNGLPDDCRQSLAVQTRWLSKRMEHHLLGNHLWTNAKALLFAGSFFAGTEAAGWLKTGLELIRRELKEQILPDGGHFELSPMYHTIVLADLLDLIQIAGTYPEEIPPDDVDAWRKAAMHMVRWLEIMTHPDGEIALFNDAAFGIAPRPTHIMNRANVLGIPSLPRHADPVHDLPDSGYVRLQKGPAVLIADTGRIGPEYLSAHAHADTLSFELSLFGNRVVVDSGTSRYDVSEERLTQRGTGAHNTLQIDGADSSEVWDSFRVARRASPLHRSVRFQDDTLLIDCGHNGYTRLRGKPIHHRQWKLSTGRLVVQDRIEGRFMKAVSRYHFHPDLEMMPGTAPRTGKVRLPEGKEISWRSKNGHAQIVASTYHPQFGLSLPNHCLEIVHDENSNEVEFAWDV